MVRKLVPSQFKMSGSEVERPISAQRLEALFKNVNSPQGWSSRPHSTSAARPLHGSRSPHTTLLAVFEAVADEFAVLPIVFYSAYQLSFLQFDDSASR